MGSRLRRIRSNIGSLPRASQLAQLQPKDIESITFDAEDETIEAEFLLPIDDGEDFATYTLSLDCDPLGEGSNPSVNHALAMLTRALCNVANNQKAANAEQDPPCTTCNSACCRDTVVRLLPTDLDRLQANGISLEHVTRYSHPSPQGYVAAINAAELPDGACCFLSDEGCTIYAHRPTICREYSAWTCAAYVEDPEKVAGKRRLLVVTES